MMASKSSIVEAMPRALQPRAIGITERQKIVHGQVLALVVAQRPPMLVEHPASRLLDDAPRPAAIPPEQREAKRADIATALGN
jgi:hypothetical protein